MRQACGDLHTGFARSRPRERLTLVQRLRSWKRFLVGPAAAWRRSIRAPPIDVSWLAGRCISSRTMSELLFPHLWGKRPHLVKIINEFKASRRVCRGSDPRHLRLTMDGLLDQHMWGATPCIKDRPRRKVRPTQHKAGHANRGTFYGQIGTAAENALENPNINFDVRRWSHSRPATFLRPPSRHRVASPHKRHSACQGELQ